MTQLDTAPGAAPEPAAPPAEEPQGTDALEAPAAPAVPPELIAAITTAVTGEVRTLHGELRRQQNEFARLIQQPRTADTAQGFAELTARLDETSDRLDLLTNSLMPEEQRAALDQQRELAKMKRDLARAQRAPAAPAPAAPTGPPPTPTPEYTQPQLAAMQLAVQSYAEALGVDLTTLTPAEQTALQQNVSTDTADSMLRGVKANIKLLAQQRAGAPAAPAQNGAAPRATPTTTVPAGRPPGPSKPRDVREAERMLAEDKISVAQFRAWGFR